MTYKLVIFKTPWGELRLHIPMESNNNAVNFAQLAITKYLKNPESWEVLEYKVEK